MSMARNKISLAILCCILAALCFGCNQDLVAEADGIAVPNFPLLESGVDCSPNEDPVITFAPNATYTTIALKRGVSGEVRIFGYFEWNGRFSGLQVITGLPGGLSESALRAAKAIRFKPATSCGKAISEPVEIHYDFPSGRSKLVLL
jgi:hypothetical protein